MMLHFEPTGLSDTVGWLYLEYYRSLIDAKFGALCDCSFCGMTIFRFQNKFSGMSNIT